MSRGLFKRATAAAVSVAMLLPSLPTFAAAQFGATPPRPLPGYEARLGDTQAIGPHYASEWEKLSDLARRAQEQGSLVKSGTPQAFLREPVDVAKVAAEVVRAGAELEAMGADMEQQFARDEQYLRERGLPAELLDRLNRTHLEFAQRREAITDGLARLAAAQRAGSYDGQKSALADFAKLIAPLPSAKSFVPMSKEALQREGEKRLPRAPLASTAALRSAIEGTDAKSLAKAAPAAPTPADLAETDAVQLTPKIRDLAASLGNNPVAITNWVRDNIDFVPTYGSIQGAEIARINQRGNATDTASLTIALLRAAGIPARYVYGVIELPIERAKNWLGGNISGNQVVELLQKGGIPAQAVIAGGAVSSVRFEHTWVEAYVDFAPSRGAVNRSAETWVPIDTSLKTYDVHAPIVLTQGAPIDASGLLAAATANVVKGPNGSVTGFNLQAVGASLDAWRPSADSYANQVKANATLGDVQGYAKIVPLNMPMLAGTVPYTIVTRGNSYSDLPDTLKHILKISFYATETDYSYDSPAFTYSMPVSTVGLSTIGVDYVPATPADASALAQLRRDNAATLSPYLINVIPQVQIEGKAVAAGGAVSMGTVQYWKADISDPQGIFPPTASGNRTVAGSHTTFVVDAAGMSPDLVQKRLDLIPDGVSYPIREGLQQAGMQFWMLHDNQDQLYASQFAGKIVRLPSVGAFSAPLTVTYAFGVARSGQFRGYQTDVKRNLYAAVNATQKQQVDMFTMIGTAGSLYESSVWEFLFGFKFTSGVSTATVLARANERGIPIYMVDSTNVAAILPQLAISSDAKQEISNAVAAGKRVVVPQQELTIGAWSGTGYVIQDPQDGTGVYQIDGGLSGGLSAVTCILKAFLESCAFQKLLAKYLAGFHEQLIAAGQSAIDSALNSAVEKLVPVVEAEASQYMWFMAFHFATIDFAVMMATGELEDTVQKILSCSYHGPCDDGLLDGLGPTGNPVMLGTGEKVQIEDDYIGGGDDALFFRRTYMSFADDTGQHMGNRWRHSYERAIVVPPPTTGDDGTGYAGDGGYSISFDTGVRAAAKLPPTPPVPGGVLAMRGNGSYYQFNLRSGVYTPDGDVPDRITRHADASGNTTGWTYVSALDDTEEYDANGKLTSVTNRQGMVTQLSYDAQGQLQSVRNQFGRTLTFTYNAAGNVDTVTDPANGLWRYGYDSFGNLTSVTGPDQKTRQYHYEQSPKLGLLTGITDENSNRFSTYTYDTMQRVVDETHSGGAEHLTIRYLSDTTVQTTDALGTVRTYQFQKVFEEPRLISVNQPCMLGCAGGNAAALSYDANGFTASKTDFNNNQTVYNHDARGLERSRTEASGSPVARTIATDYDSTWRVATKLTESTSAGNRITNFTLDTRGNVLTKAVTVAGETRTWTYTYNGVGQRLTEDGPRTDVADVTTWTYVSGNVDTMTDAAGNVTRYANYDAHGRPQTITDPNGLITTLTYDPRGRLKTSSAGGETTGYDYDGVGNLQRLTLPDGTYLQYGYDAAQRLTSIADSLGNSVTYTLDDQGNRKQEDTRDPTGALAQTMSRVFDGLSQVKTLLGALSQPTGYTYDAQGNLKTASDPLGHVTSNDYDALNRLIKVTEPQLASAPTAGTIGYGYDAQDNLKSVTDQRGLVTSYDYSGFDELKTLTSPDTGVTSYTYDPAGNVKTMQDARGQGATYTYDAVNRLKSLLYNDESLGFTYDDTTIAPNSKGRLSKVTDGSGSTTYGYDTRGRVTLKTQVAGSVTSTVRYAYNAQGQLASIATPSGQLVEYGYGNNQITSIKVNGQVVLQGVKYFPFGEVASWTWGNGKAYARVYDSDGRIKSVTLGGVTRAYGFDDASRITSLGDSEAATNSVTVGYDNLDHLTSAKATAAGSYDVAYEYDGIGNRTSQVVSIVSATTAGPKVTLTYAPTSNRLMQVGTQAIGYDAVGNTASDANFTYKYSGRNRLVEVDQAGSAVATYKHNAFGERVSKTLGGTVTTFLYDEDGHLLGEYGAAGALIQETVWLEDTPVATLRPKSGGGADIYYVWADHLDTPRAITTSAAVDSVVWRWDSDPFGTASAQEAGLSYNLRFPGQYFDSESALHYNYLRDYVPANGRYAESDPISLWGGLNTYAYVSGLPNIFFDPYGLSKGKGGGHSMGATVSRDGVQVCKKTYTSGNMTNEQKNMGWPLGSLDSHTEAKACRDLQGCLQPGDVVHFEGARPPCNSCKGRMNSLAASCGVSVCYSWNGPKGSGSWTASGRGRGRR